MFSQLSVCILLTSRLWSSSCPPSTTTLQLPSLVFLVGIARWWDCSTALPCITDPVRGGAHQAGEHTANQQQINTVTQLREPDTNTHQSAAQTLPEPLGASTRCPTFILTHDFSQEPSLGSCYPLPSRLPQNQKEPAFIKPKPGLS